MFSIISSFFAKSKIYVILFLVTSTIITGTYTYIQYLRSENETLSGNNIKLENAITTQQETISGLNSNITEIKNINKKLNAVRVRNQNNLSKLNKKFTKGATRDFTYLSYKKPGLIENIINKATKERLECLGYITKDGGRQNAENTTCNSNTSAD